MDCKVIKLRPATLADSDTLLNWRNDPETRNASHSPEVVSNAEHLKWLETSLNSPTRQLFIAEEGGVPVGSARADFLQGCHVLSWTVAPHARGRGVARRMMELLVDQISGPIRAEVKAGNMASVRIAESVGMKFEKEIDNVLHFFRTSQT